MTKMTRQQQEDLEMEMEMARQEMIEDGTIEYLERIKEEMKMEERA